MDKKTKLTIAGVLFLVCGANRLLSYVTFVMQCVSYGSLDFVRPFNLMSPIAGAIAVALGIAALKGKERGSTLTVLGYVYMIYAAYGLVMGMRNTTIVTGLVWLVVFAAAFILSKPADSAVSTKDTTSQAAQEKIQTEKQESIYDQQLREGILTQDEYDQITGRK